MTFFCAVRHGALAKTITKAFESQNMLITKGAFSMKKTIAKRLSNFALALAVVFCAAAMLPSKASAEFGDPPSGSVSMAGSTFRYQIYFSNTGKTAATATSSFGKISGLTASCALTYQYHDPKALKPQLKTATVYANGSNASTSVSATAQRDSSHTQQYTAMYADGIHTLSYDGITANRTTRVSA